MVVKLHKSQVAVVHNEEYWEFSDSGIHLGVLAILMTLCRVRVSVLLFF